MIKKDKLINEKLLPLYLYMFVFLRVPIVLGIYDKELNFIVLFVSAVLILIISIFSTFKTFKIRNFLIFVAISIFVAITFSVSTLGFYNEKILAKLMDFIIYAFISMYLFSQIGNIKEFLKFFGYLSILVYLIYFMDPFLNYKFSFEYMIFGYQVMVPAFIGILVLYSIKKNYILILFMAAAFIETLLWGNRMAVISILLSIGLYQFFINKKKKEIVLILFGIILFSTIFSESIIYFLEQVNVILIKNKLFSYPISSMLNFLNNQSMSILQGRANIWNQAIQLIKDNILFGIGIGTFESNNGYYVHNIIFDVILNYGFIIGLLVIVWSVYSIYNLFSISKRDNILIGILFVSISFPKLFFSIDYFQEPMFWLLLFSGFSLNENNIKSFDKVM